MDIKELGGVYLIHLTHNTCRYRAVMKTAKNFRVLCKARNFLSSRGFQEWLSCIKLIIIFGFYVVNEWTRVILMQYIKNQGSRPVLRKPLTGMYYPSIYLFVFEGEYIGLRFDKCRGGKDPVICSCWLFCEFLASA